MKLPFSNFSRSVPSPDVNSPVPILHASPKNDNYFPPPSYTPADDMSRSAIPVHSRRHQTLLDKILLWTQLVFSFLALVLSTAIIGCAAHSLHAHRATNLPATWMLPLWPASLDLSPAETILACGVLGAVTSLVVLAAGFVPSVSALQPSILPPELLLTAP